MTTTPPRRRLPALLLLLLSLMPPVMPRAAAPPPATGFTLHFDFLNSPQDAETLLDYVLKRGARLLNVVPPPRIWEDPLSLSILRRIFAFAAAHDIGVILTRIDASRPAADEQHRRNYLYTHILNRPGRLPDGSPTPDFFCATVGNAAFVRWQEEETAFYARHFSAEKALVAFSIGMFNEPFVSQRGSLLCFSHSTGTYEIAQYTPAAAALWRRDLARRFTDIHALNRSYRSAFPAFSRVPLPRNEHDPRFGDAPAAYWDFTRLIHRWVQERYESCRTVWRRHALRPRPFLLQFSGFDIEKIVKGRPAFAALDVFSWMARADGLGLSFYTNGGYPDRGHASARAMVHLMQLGRLLGKPIYVLESGFEENGAAADHGELRFIAVTSRSLRPLGFVYEFLKMTYDESFHRHDGKLLDRCFRENPDCLREVRSMFAAVQEPPVQEPPVYVLFPPDALRRDAIALGQYRRLLALAAERPLCFVPVDCLAVLPAGVELAVPGRPADHPGLSGRRLISWSELLAR